MLENPRENPKWIATYPNSVAFVYEDQTFRGRVVIVLKRHAEQITELPLRENSELYTETLQTANAVQKAVTSERINLANLGNEVPHLHWHIIPRFPNDPNPGRPPWPAPETKLSEEEYTLLAERIRDNLEHFESVAEKSG